MHQIQSIIVSILLTHLVLYSKAQQAAVNGWLMSLNTFKIDNNFCLLFENFIPFSGTTNLDGGAYAALQNEIFVNIGDKSSINGKLFD